MAEGRAYSLALPTSCPPRGCEHIALNSLSVAPSHRSISTSPVVLLMDNCTSWPGFPTPTPPLTHAEPICPRSGGKKAALPTLEGGEWDELPGSIERKPRNLGMSISISQCCSAPPGEVLCLSWLSLAVRLRSRPSKAKTHISSQHSGKHRVMVGITHTYTHTGSCFKHLVLTWCYFGRF